MNKRFIVGTIAVIIGGVATWAGPSRRSNTPANPTASTQTREMKSSTETQASLITFSSSGFSPLQMTIKAGTTIEIKNTSNQTLQFDSDPHPMHTDYETLNLGTIEPGESASVTLNRVGTWGYHNHLNPSEQGKISVQ